VVIGANLAAGGVGAAVGGNRVDAFAFESASKCVGGAAHVAGRQNTRSHGTTPRRLAKLIGDCANRAERFVPARRLFRRWRKRSEGKRRLHADHSRAARPVAALSKLPRPLVQRSSRFRCLPRFK